MGHSDVMLYLNHAAIQTPPHSKSSSSVEVARHPCPWSNVKGGNTVLVAQHSKSANGPRIPPGTIHIAYLSIQFEFDNEKKAAGLIDLPLIGSYPKPFGIVPPRDPLESKGGSGFSLYELSQCGECLRQLIQVYVNY